MKFVSKHSWNIIKTTYVILKLRFSALSRVLRVAFRIIYNFTIRLFYKLRTCKNCTKRVTYLRSSLTYKKAKIYNMTLLFCKKIFKNVDVNAYKKKDLIFFVLEINLQRMFYRHNRCFIFFKYFSLLTILH